MQTLVRGIRMARGMNKAHRLKEMIELLELKPWTTQELAQKLAVEQRMIQRDIKELRLSHPVTDLENNKYQIIKTGSNLNAVEALAVHAAVRLLYHHSPSSNRHYRSALEKFAKMLPNPAREIAANSAQDLSAMVDRTKDDRALELVAEAWFSQKVLKFNYQPLGKEKTEKRELEAYFVEVSRDNLALYAIGFERTFQNIVTYKLSRMSQIFVLQDTSYEIPTDFDPQPYLSTAWGIMGSKPTTIKLRFSPEAAVRIREGGYPNLTIGEEDNEGWLHVSIVAGTDNNGFPTEILPWVQTWGAKVDVIAPIALRNRWHEQAVTLALQTPYLQKHIASLVDAATQENSPMKYLSEQAASLWAKTNSDKTEGYSLLGHLLDVAAVAKTLLEREPESTKELYAQDLGLSKNEAITWVAALAGLHDIGKATPSFQQKWELGRQIVKNTGLTFTGDKDVPHGQLSQKILEFALRKYNLSKKLAKQIADAVGAHHGFRSDTTILGKILSTDLGEEGWFDEQGDWFNVQTEIIDIFMKTLQIAHISAPDVSKLSGAAFMRLAGLTSFVDWIGSTTDFFPTDRTVINPNDHFADAKKRANKALNTIGWERYESLMDEELGFEEIFPFQPNALQKNVAALAEGSSKPSLFVIEAPMGEGKTEAAFYAHALLQYKFKHRGMYIALPTQATGNAMFERSLEMLKSFSQQNEDLQLDLQLLHSANELVNSYTYIQVKEVGGIGEESGEVYARAWFANKKRALLSENGVGTVDQALLSVLNIRHHFIRMWGLGNRTIIFDEVHAYQLYTSKLIERLVSWLHALGSSVIIMSATLPRRQRLELLTAFGANNDIAETNAVPYPRISHVCDGVARAVTFDVSERSNKTVQIATTDLATEAIAKQLQDFVSEEGCAVAIVNTVQRAQEIYQFLEGNEKIPAGKKLADGTEVYLFHARYPAQKRQERENIMLDRFGKKGTRPKKAILIATQVVEQSLDLDFDVMISDLAPIDLLLQRSGRMHRHPRDHRPTKHQKPTLYVAGLSDINTLPDLKTGHFSAIYDALTLYKTWQTLAKQSKITLPDDFEPLIEAVYDENNENFPEIAKAAMQTAQKEQNEEQNAHIKKATDEEMTVIRLPQKYAKQIGLPKNILAEDDEDPSLHEHYRPATRLGEPSVMVIPLHRYDGKLFLDIDYQSEVFPHRKPHSKLAKTIYKHNVKLSRKAVVYALTNFHEKTKTDSNISTSTKNGWQDNALLRNAYPLIFEDGKVVIGETTVIFSKELGIKFEASLT